LFDIVSFNVCVGEFGVLEDYVAKNERVKSVVMASNDYTMATKARRKQKRLGNKRRKSRR
jgi:hypothetical protein